MNRLLILLAIGASVVTATAQTLFTIPTAAPGVGLKTFAEMVNSNSVILADRIVSYAGVAGADTNLAAPLKLMVYGDSLSAYVQPDASIPAWSTQLTNRFRQWSNLVNVAVGGHLVTNQAAIYAYTNAPHQPTGGTNGILAFWIGNNDVSYDAASVVISNASNFLVTAKAAGWKIALFDLHTSGWRAAGDAPETSQVLYNHWARNSTLWDYFVPVSELFPNTNTTWYWDNIHLNSNGQYRVMNAFVEAIAKGPRSVQPNVLPFVISTNRHFAVYDDMGRLPFRVAGGTGYVGIGREPTHPLTVESGIAVFGSQASVSIVDSLATLSWWTDTGYTKAAQITLNSTDDLNFRSFATGNWTNNLTIRSATGNVGIATNAPAARLHVFGTTTNTVRIDTGVNAGPTVTNGVHWLPVNLNGTNGWVPLFY